NNAIYAPNGRAIVANGMVAQITAIANAGTGSLSGVASGFNAGGQIASDFFAASLAGAPPQNVVPKSALLVGTADSSSLPYDDFAGVARGAHHDIGAFRAIASGDPGWALAAAFKVLDGIFAGDFESHP
ncbi:MAG TPA: hypothetical protein VF132_12155, partial [Rudaea sp.]